MCELICVQSQTKVIPCIFISHTFSSSKSSSSLQLKLNNDNNTRADYSSEIFLYGNHNIIVIHHNIVEKEFIFQSNYYYKNNLTSFWPRGVILVSVVT